MVGWLPCIRHGTQRFFLPRSHRTGEVIARVLLASREERSASDSSLVAMVVDRFRNDPAWLIHALATYGDGAYESVADDHDAGAGHGVGVVHGAETDDGDRFNGPLQPTSIDLPHLAYHWIAGCLDQFAGGEAFLSSPEMNPSRVKAYDSLRNFFKTLPVERWPENAGLWFEVSGAVPDPTWFASWPTIADPQSGIGNQNGLGKIDSSGVETGDWLQILARQIQSAQVISQSFDQTLHQKQMESLRQLAYGLSHEINNPLANISTRAEALIRDEMLPPSQTLSESDRHTSRTETLKRIVDQVYRAYGMISDLMFYASPPEPVLEIVDLGILVDRVLDEFVGSLSLQSIRMDRRLVAGISVRIDRAMFGEAVRGLVRNAVDAIGCQGTIVISSEVVRLGSPGSGTTGSGSTGLDTSGGMIRLHIADSGPGLSEEARQHAFDPYYSGREAGRGLGLGLCRAYRIVELHGGELSLAGGPAGCVATITL